MTHGKIIITPSFLDDCCKPKDGKSATIEEAWDAALKLGPLAPFWLNTDTLQKAAELDPGYRDYWLTPQLPSQRGGCWVVCALRSPQCWPMLRGAVVIPLLWEEGMDHDDCLPIKLSEFADQLLHDLRGVVKLQGKSRRLRLCFPGDASATRDLRDFDIELDSGWVPLAGGLLLLADHIAPQPTVWATGDWDTNLGGITHVSNLEAKLELAQSWPIAVTKVFVPSGNEEQVRKWQSQHPDHKDFVQTLNGTVTNPEQALKPYLALLGAPPTLDESLSDESYGICKAYYALQDPSRATVYYLESILPRVLRDQRAKVANQYPALQPTHFVTIISGSRELAVLGPLIVGAKKCLLLHTKDMARAAQDVQSRLRQYGLPDSFPEQFELHDLTFDMAKQLSDLIQKFLAGVSHAERVVFDVTPGKKTMTLALDHLAPLGSWIMYMEHELRTDKKPDLEKEIMVRRYRAGDSLSQRLVIPSTT